MWNPICENIFLEAGVKMPEGYVSFFTDNEDNKENTQNE